MIHIILVEDNEIILKEVSLFIEKMFFKLNYSCIVHSFTEYGIDYEKFLYEKLENKIFLFDIEIIDKKGGIEAAEEMRKIDLHSPLIFLTVHETYINRIIKSKLDCFRFISKKEDYLSLIEDSIQHLLLKICGSDVMVIKDGQQCLSIPYDSILYFTTEVRKVVVVTELRKLYMNTSLKKLEIMLPNYFIRTQKACIVNMKKVLVYNYKNGNMVFSNDRIGGLLSKTYQSKIDKHLKTNKKDHKKRVS